MAQDLNKTVWTVGHSTRSADDFLSLLREHDIRLLVDVRAHPGSRRYPHFNKPELEALLKAAGVDYLHMEGLGGRRKPCPDSRNVAWKNASFRAYADYMETGDFARAAAQLERLAAERPTALMCSEAVWWRCHRSLIADWLKARGWTVLHILDPAQTSEHPYTAPARLIDGRLSYRDPELF